MKCVILAGGFGTRISEETDFKPKPMVEIGGKPILWHIMKYYSHFGIKDFIICCGYKGHVIKEYFSNYYLHNTDITINLFDNSREVHEKFAEPWRVTLIDTGQETMTGGRLLRAKELIKDDNFLFTYGDGLSNINISKLAKFHLHHKKIATVSAVYPPGRFGSLDISARGEVNAFQEKPQGDGAQVSGGFFVFSKYIFDYLEDDSTILEQSPLRQLALDNELMAYKHNDFWQPMDTLRDKVYLEDLWKKDMAPWKIWT